MKDNFSEITNYIIKFLLGVADAEFYASKIGYTNDEKLFDNYKLVIIPSSFFDKNIFGTKQSVPQLPLNDFEGTPLLFGTPKTEKKGDTTIIHADIVASTFYLISRYEETIFREKRDQHGRFLGKDSILGCSKLMHRPIVDEYGQILRKLLKTNKIEIDEPPKLLKKIYLTHDVDKLVHYKNVKSVAKAIAKFYKNPKLTITALKTFFGKIDNDPWFTFPLIFELSEKLQNNYWDIENILFIKPGGSDKKEDQPTQNIKSKGYQYLFDLADKNNYQIGLHPSYEAGIEPNRIKEEKNILEKVTKEPTRLIRHHYLTSREPEDMQTLIDNGFTDDFTMGYADMAGFRLGTCRAVRWIDPTNLKLTNLTLHPLTVMDNSLSEKRYMNLNEKEALEYVIQLIEQTKKHNGDLTLLWHNTAIEKNNNQYQRALYKKVINYLSKI